MAVSTVLASPDTSARSSASVYRGFLRLLPGVALLFGIGFLGKLIEHEFTHLRTEYHLRLPQIEYVLWAIILGLIVSNSVGVKPIFRPGVATYELWLKLGIVLVGARFVFSDVLRIGTVSLVLVFIELALSLTVMTLLGRIFGLRPKLTSLLAIGSSICGVTAIMAARGAIEPEEEDVSTSIAAILTLGAIALFTFPAIGHLLHLSQESYGIWTGLAVDNTAEATVTGALYGDVAGRFAILAKTARSAFIGFVVLGYAVYWASKGQAPDVPNKAMFLWQKFPKFILGFLVISVLASSNFFNASQLSSLSNLSRWAFLPAFAGVGLRTNLRDLTGQGWRPIVVGILGEIFIALVTLGLVYWTFIRGDIR
ncbi:MAG: putative sulfate exporter family transporter [Acidobacteriaceae bacterium]|nr:putative sulfate exporter family transporter [Acidobacteriaceae bacterium]